MPLFTRLGLGGFCATWHKGTMWNVVDIAGECHDGMAWDMEGIHHHVALTPMLGFRVAAIAGLDLGIWDCVVMRVSCTRSMRLL